MLLWHRISHNRKLVYFLLVISILSLVPGKAPAEETMPLRAAVAKALKNNHEILALKNSLASHKEFADSQKKLTDKLAAEKALEKWTYLVSDYTLDSLLKKRGELLSEKPEATAAGTEVNSESEAPNSSDGVTE